MRRRKVMLESRKPLLRYAYQDRILWWRAMPKNMSHHANRVLCCVIGDFRKAVFINHFLFPTVENMLLTLQMYFYPTVYYRWQRYMPAYQDQRWRATLIFAWPVMCESHKPAVHRSGQSSHQDSWQGDRCVKWLLCLLQFFQHSSFVEWLRGVEIGGNLPLLDF